MDLQLGTPLDRWLDPELTTSPGWVDASGRSPVTLYREYLQRRREWEGRAWKLHGTQDPRFTRALDELAALHADLSTAAPLETRDQSVSKPPSRDHRTVRIIAVDRSADAVALTTAEDEFAGLGAITYRVAVTSVDGRWRLKARIADFRRGRRVNGL